MRFRKKQLQKLLLAVEVLLKQMSKLKVYKQMFVRTTFIRVRKCVKVFTASQIPTEFLWPNNAALHRKNNICGRKKVSNGLCYLFYTYILTCQNKMTPKIHGTLVNETNVKCLMIFVILLC